jgi:hypothetical protein
MPYSRHRSGSVTFACIRILYAYESQDSFSTPIGSLSSSPNPSMFDDAVLPPEVAPDTWTHSHQPRSRPFRIGTFVTTEVQSTRLPQSLLVAPSGSLDSPLIARAHYPNFDQRHMQFERVSIKDPFNWSKCVLQQKLGVWGTTADDQMLLHDLFCRRIPRLKAKHLSSRVRTVR